MENFSRVKKNSELYQQLHTDTKINLSSDKLEKYVERLNKIDDEITDKMKLESTSVNPLHARKLSELEENVTKTPANSGFSNEYLDEFISEVKQYNIQKGLRVSEDTQTNIMHNINLANGSRQEPKKVEEPVINEEKDQTFITAQLKKLVANEELTPEADTEQTVQEVANDDKEDLLVETQKLRKLIQKHDTEIDQVNDHVKNTNHILNFVLVLLFLTLLLALGGLVYFLLTNRGLL